MKIDILKVIQDALIGGKNGELAFIYNNHFIRDIFDSYEPGEEINSDLNHENEKFRLFMKDILAQQEQGSQSKESCNLKLEISIEKIKDFLSKEDYNEYEEEYNEYIKNKDKFITSSRIVSRKLSDNPILQTFTTYIGNGEKIYFDINDCKFKGKIMRSKIEE